jgi:hypothetical protein
MQRLPTKTSVKGESEVAANEEVENRHHVWYGGRTPVGHFRTLNPEESIDSEIFISIYSKGITLTMSGLGLPVEMTFDTEGSRKIVSLLDYAKEMPPATEKEYVYVDGVECLISDWDESGTDIEQGALFLVARGSRIWLKPEAPNHLGMALRFDKKDLGALIDLLHQATSLFKKGKFERVPVIEMGDQPPTPSIRENSMPVPKGCPGESIISATVSFVEISYLEKSTFQMYALPDRVAIYYEVGQGPGEHYGFHNTVTFSWDACAHLLELSKKSVQTASSNVEDWERIGQIGIAESETAFYEDSGKSFTLTLNARRGRVRLTVRPWFEMMIVELGGFREFTTALEEILAQHMSQVPQEDRTYFYSGVRLMKGRRISHEIGNLIESLHCESPSTKDEDAKRFDERLVEFHSRVCEALYPLWPRGAELKELGLEIKEIRKELDTLIEQHGDRSDISFINEYLSKFEELMQSALSLVV